MADINERIEDINKLIFEIAEGNFNYHIERSANNDELDAIVIGINMLREELKESTVSRDYMNTIYKGVVDLLFVLDQDFIVQIVNESVTNSLCFDKNEIIDKPFFVLANESATEMSKVKEMLSNNKYIDNVELYLKTKSGFIIPTSCTVSQLYDNHKQKNGILVIAKNITQQKLIEEELRSAKDYAEAANVAKSRFIANMSHEIRTPLNGILGLAEIMLAESINPTHKEYLDIIKNSGQSLTRLINDILDFSKIESGKLVLENIPFNFKEVLISNLHPYKHQAEAKDLILQYTIDSAIPKTILGDPTRINQIIVNLVSNAIKFSTEGTIDISFKAKEILQDEIIIEGIVKDNGIGIPEEKKEMIFQSFTQADDSITRQYGGTGLGLNIVKNLLGQMEGSIRVQSPADVTLNRGSAFIFTMKLKVPEQQAEVEQPVVITETDKMLFNKALNILLVDDNKVNLLMTKRMLQKNGAQVSLAENGQEAIDMTRTAMYDIVLMDIQMPVMDGYNATIELRKLKFDKPIVALTANAYSDHVEKSIACGMNGHLQKPFTSQQLFQIVQQFTA